MPSKAYLSKNTVYVLDKPYTVFYHDDKQYNKIGPKGSKAFCAFYVRRIHFNCEHLVPRDGVVVHELTHAYIHELMGHDLNLSREENEEFVCTLVEKHAHDILARAAPLTRKLIAHGKRLKQNKPQAEAEEEDDE